MAENVWFGYLNIFRILETIPWLKYPNLYFKVMLWYIPLFTFLLFSKKALFFMKKKYEVNFFYRILKFWPIQKNMIA